LFFAIASCNSDSNGDIENTIDPDSELVDNFTISGKVTGGENLNFYIEAMSQQGTISVTQVQSDSSGNFELLGNIPGFGLYHLRMGESNEKIIPVTLVPGDKVELKSDFATFSETPNITGTKWATVMTQYMVLFSKFQKDQNELMKLQGTLSNDEFSKKYSLLKAELDQFSIDKMNEDPSNPFNIVLSSSASPSMGFQDWDPNNLKVLKKVSEAFLTAYKDSPMSTTLSNQVYQVEIAYNKYLADNSGTRVAPEITLNDPDGKEIRLSSLRNNYVLIDFWASWCGPCRKESPNVVRMYNKYKNKGFTVYSVSLDDNVEAWRTAIASDGLTWPNHVSDLLKWKSPLPHLYGFKGIPYTVLIDKEGKIIGTGLRGASLEQKLKEIFGN
jgi:thiol-disulfide isomerase/thioredoxin